MDGRFLYFGCSRISVGRICPREGGWLLMLLMSAVEGVGVIRGLCLAAAPGTESCSEYD